jgi:capsular exopolysaccharide synthesis family protein
MLNSNNTKKEKSILEILHIVYLRKNFIIISVVVALILAVLYNQFSTPVYESVALLKKEKEDKNTGNELYDIVKLQTQDEIETEMELVKTGDVLNGVIDELKLCIQLKEIVTPTGNSHELDHVFIEFPDSGNTFAQRIGFSIPLFQNFKLKENDKEQKLYIRKKGENRFELRNAEDDNLIIAADSHRDEVEDKLDVFNNFTLDADSIIIAENLPTKVLFDTKFAHFDFSWEDAPVGSIIYFDFGTLDLVLEGLDKKISVSKVGKTNVFKLSVKSSSKFAAKMIAKTLIDKFRDTRIEQQKQTIRYSFKFVDEQLTEVQTKLLNAESNLSSFKSSGQIMTIDANSRELINYLSTLEAEKLGTDLLLSDYKNKVEAMKNELQESEYFDQSFLEPEGQFESSSPFSTLMKRLSDLELQRLDLLQKRTENHPEVINLNEQIRSTEDKLASYNQNTLTAYNIIINTQEKKLLKIANLMSKYEVKMQRLPAQENRMARLVREKDAYEKIFTLLLDKREEMRMAELSKLQDIVVVDQPQEPLEPIAPRKKLNMLIALILGGFIGIVSIFLIELKNTRLIDIDDLEEEFKIPILALIPKYDKDIVKRIDNPMDNNDRFVVLMGDNLGIRESYRLLKTKLFYHLDGREKICLITSCEENTGKTNIVANLAITIAKENKKVLIIDCDLRKAELSKMFDISLNSPGLIDFITKGGSPAIYNRVLKNIDILPAGGIREDSSSLLGSDRMKSLFKAIDTSAYDYIIIDTPPVTRVVDTLVLGQSVKNAILVVRPDISMKEAVLGGIQELNQAKIKIRGVVANSADIHKSYYYRYRYGYGYGYFNSDNGRNHAVKKDGSVVHKSSKVRSS